MYVFVMGQVFFVACYHVKHCCERVEIEIEVSSVDREEDPLPGTAFGAGLLLFDGGLEK